MSDRIQLALICGIGFVYFILVEAHGGRIPADSVPDFVYICIGALIAIQTVNELINCSFQEAISRIFLTALFSFCVFGFLNATYPTPDGSVIPEGRDGIIVMVLVPWFLFNLISKKRDESQESDTDPDSTEADEDLRSDGTE